MDKERALKAIESINALKNILKEARYYTLHDNELDNLTMMNILNNLRLRNTHLYMAISILVLKYGLDINISPFFRGLL